MYWFIKLILPILHCKTGGYNRVMILICDVIMIVFFRHYTVLADFIVVSGRDLVML